MTKRDELLALAERCEKVSEGSRELDGAIAAALSLHPQGWRRGASEASASAVWFDDFYNWRAPDLTTSLDAAMTLVPPGHDWSLFFDNGAALAGCMPASDDGCDWTDVPGSTPALAICAAALRAQAEMEPY